MRRLVGLAVLLCAQGTRAQFDHSSDFFADPLLRRDEVVVAAW